MPTRNATPTPPATTPTPDVSAAPVAAPFVRSAGFDLRGTVAGAPGAVYVIARGPVREATSGDAPAGDRVVRARVVSSTPSGEAVRILGPRGACDGTLGARVELTAQQTYADGKYRSVFAHAVVGCRDAGWFAVVEPPPASTMPVPLAATAPEGQRAVAAAREAATRVTNRVAGTWVAPPHVYRFGDAVYALVEGPACEYNDVPCTMVAVARAREGRPAEVLLVRPTHFVWDPPANGEFEFGALTDVDGDGTLEVVEHMSALQGAALRLVRVGERTAGDVAWTLTAGPDVPFPLRVGPVPPPAAADAPQP